MELIQATEQNTDELLSFYQHVADNMKESGLKQWHWGKYPSEEMIREDIAKGDLYYLRTENSITASVVLMAGQEPEYRALHWSCGIHPGIFHRLAVHPSMQGAGLGGLVLDDVQQILRRAGCDCIRCDTSVKNDRAQKLYEKMGFRRCGTLHWPDSVGDNVTFDKPLKRETPLWPIPMTPAFRSGSDTPWGGTKLRDRFGKEIPDETTGESLEISCIPGLESRDPMGRTLPELIREYGVKLVGDYADKPFPLLLKLIDARDRLSVQVHPDDVYAASREGGKLGKTEAWMVLDTPENGEIVYGIKPGTSLKELKEASRNGAAVEPLLRRVPVRRGDVCYIPAGCVHSIPAGMMMYEIQESSDLTYRFYDWDRTDAAGRKRELHLGKALDVTDLKCSPAVIRVEKGYGVRRILSEGCFTMDVIHTDSMETLPEIQNFGLLTTIDGRIALRWAGTVMPLAAGRSCFLPKNSPDLAVEGTGTAVLSMPV